ncbi:MAG: winged helix-turn-helix transcriptional regulator [Polyangiaceae bacterium]|nr:winged helix-turn-helix transcriptional regulator [Polyangiaceae bacterium]
MSSDEIFEALGHPDRRHILELLQAAGELSAGELAEHFSFSKPTLSHHLKALVAADLLDRERRGQFVYYRINMSVAEELVQAVLTLLGKQRPKPRRARRAT